jgi:hypothetical protein
MTKRPPLISLTTDFGLADTYVGVMKAVILGIAPSARLIDMTHEIAPQNVLEATVRLAGAVDYFPPGTIHLVVVDPGVGSERAACVVETETATYVAPDNGVLTLPLRRQTVVRAVRLGPEAEPFFLKPISDTFHGRDVFAPVAAHIAIGLDPTRLGAVCPPESLVALDLQEPTEFTSAAGAPALRAPVLYADRFGNLVTALTHDAGERWLARHRIDPASAMIVAGKRRWHGVRRTFADVPPGDPVAYWGSGDRLEVGIRNGDAARTLGVTAVEIHGAAPTLPGRR